MKLRVIAPSVLIALTAVGCGDRPEAQLHGRWLGEAITNVYGAELAAATGWVRGTSFEFGRSKLTVVIPTELPRSGPFSIESAKGPEMVIAVSSPNGAVDRAALRLESDNELRWHLGEGRDIIMRRAQ